MNLWIINQYADGPEGQATRDFDRAKILVGKGHQVTIFSSGFSQYHLTEKHDYAGTKYKIDSPSGVRFIWIKSFAYKKNNWRRYVNMILFAWQAYWIARSIEGNPDVIIGTSVHPLNALAGKFLASYKKARFFFAVTDLWPETLVDMGIIGKYSPITLLMRRLEKYLYNKAEKILTVLPYAHEYIEGMGIEKSKVIWISNGVEMDYYSSIKKYQGGSTNNLTLMYIGGHAPHLGLDVIIDAAAILQKGNKNNVRIIMIGSGVEKKRLMEKTSALKLNNIEFRDPVPKPEVYKSMEEADVLVCHFRDLPLLKYGTSMFKIFDYLASGRPIIYGVNGKNNPVKEAGAGITIEPDNAEILASTILEFASMDPKERSEMGSKGPLYVEKNYSIAVLAAKLEEVL
jgi:glycosyltransferase involved in cell wall biosynthesis|tara:strand:- start:238 stop:1437 length:1200 start_codon:yes stop_codon:yes gene_type:complete